VEERKKNALASKKGCCFDIRNKTQGEKKRQDSRGEKGGGTLLIKKEKKGFEKDQGEVGRPNENEKSKGVVSCGCSKKVGSVT